MQMKVTFIGGAHDMTRKIMDVNSSFVRMPRMPESPAYFMPPEAAPQFETLRIDTYRVHKIGREHAIAIFEDLP